MILRVLIFATLLAAIPAPGSAFLHIWRPPSPLVQSIDPLTGIREAGCGNPQFVVEKFGETAFMRGEMSRRGLSQDFQRALAAAAIAEDPVTAKAVLGNYLSDAELQIASTARLQVAWVLLRTAADPRRVADEVRKTLQAVQLAGAEADVFYMNAVLAFHEGRYDRARDAAAKALGANNQYYNARVLLTILDLRRIDREIFPSQSCERSIAALTETIAPVLQLGACPLHVAHLDLSIRRYLGEPSQQHRPEAAYIRSIILAYVSRNDALRRFFLKQYERQPPSHRRCLGAVGQHSFGRIDT